MALNSDGVAKGNPSIAGGGRILRDNKGLFVRAFNGRFGCCSAYWVERMAVVRGPQLARDLGVASSDKQYFLYPDILGQGAEQWKVCVHIIN